MKKQITALIWIVLVAVLVFLLLSINSSPPRQFVEFETFRRQVQSDLVAEVRVPEEGWIEFTDLNGRHYVTVGALDGPLRQALAADGASISFGEAEDGGSSKGWLVVAIPIALLVFFLIYFYRKSQGSTGNIFKMLKSPHRAITAAESSITFADVGGCEEAKELLSDVIDFLNEPQRWLESGARLPRGILLEGPPGCGKTLLARAVAGETKSKFLSISGSDFVELFVGVGASRVRDLFESAVRQAPAVVFIDEIDAVGRRRGSGLGTSHDEREQTLNQLLVCLDGFKPSDQVVVIAATNRPDVLDQALVRPGRIDRRVRVPDLSEAQRLEVLRIHTRSKPLAPESDLEGIARRTADWTGAQLENLANEAALRAVRRARAESSSAVRITPADFDQALTTLKAFDARFNRLDSILIESASQLAEPTGLARVRLTLDDGPAVEGEVVWADGCFLKLRGSGGQPDLVVAKRRVRLLEALDGTGLARQGEVVADPWVGRSIDTSG